MEQQVEETGPVERKLRVEVPTAEVDAAFDAVYAALGRTARVKGFRKGRIPRSVVQRYFGEQARGEVLERLVGETLARAVEAESLDLVTQPQLEPADPPSPGMPFVYEARLEIRPEVVLERYKGIEVEAPTVPEPEQDPVEAHLEELRTGQAPVIDEPEGTAAAEGHLVSVDFDATIDGEPFDGGSGREMVVEIGAGRTLPGFDEQLVGLAGGQEHEFDLTFPEDYPPEELRDKTAHFRVTVQAVKRRDLPELDDEFAKDVSEFDTLEAFRTELQSRVEKGRAEERERLVREAVIDAVIEANPFDVPPSLVERQLGSRLQRAIGQLRGMPEERLRALVDGWATEWRPHAERDVRLAFLVTRIAEAESIEVDEAEVDAQLKRIAEERQEPLSTVKRAYREQGVLDAMRSGLLEQRVVEFLVSEASLSDS